MRSRLLFLSFLSLLALSLCCASISYADDSSVQADKSARIEKKMEQRVEKRVEKLSAELTLSDAQKVKLEAILKEENKKIRALRQEMRRQLKEYRKNSREKIKTILDAEQLKKYEDLLAKKKEKREAREKRKEKMGY